eukprot:TRINITY_DN3248_c0_g1_i4.p1 TRINITY_DN3248_c0_g1~~TRINITY_DN3248_c0_g1_i4.p1  ORF type:complete len:198 (+),score=24.22 TRINITY_DN3248_c0_g1_i4:423-1016(+)
MTQSNLDEVLSITNSTSNITFSSGGGLNSYISFGLIPSPSTPGGPNGLLYNDGFLRYKTASTTTILTNPYNNDLSTTGTPTHAGMTLNGNLDMTNDNILNIGTATATTINSGTLYTNVLDTNAGFITIPASASIVGSGEDFNVTTGNTITYNPTQDETATKMAVIDSSNIIRYKDLSGFLNNYTTSSTILLEHLYSL